MDEKLIETLHETHVTIWNEKDRAKRETLMHSIYAEDIKMYDKEFILQGIRDISDFIEKLHTQMSQFRFSVPEPLTVVQNGIRAYWQISTDQAPGNIEGMDFFVIEHEKVAHLYAFM